MFAVGNPLGYDATYTAGVVSAVRELGLSGGPVPVSIFQVQASVNPGHSGGGLYTEKGELLGVNTWASDKTVSEGLGFAIAVSSVAAALRKSDPERAALVVSPEAIP